MAAACVSVRCSLPCGASTTAVINTRWVATGYMCPEHSMCSSSSSSSFGRSNTVVSAVWYQNTAAETAAAAMAAAATVADPSREHCAHRAVVCTQRIAVLAFCYQVSSCDECSAAQRITQGTGHTRREAYQHRSTVRFLGGRCAWAATPREAYSSCGCCGGDVWVCLQRVACRCSQLFECCTWSAISNNQVL
jgi:hypothetical protein